MANSTRRRPRSSQAEIASEAVRVVGRALPDARRASGRRCRTPSSSATTRSCAANGYIAESPTPTAWSASWSPTRCSSTRRRRTLTAGPQFAEHTDDILRELGKSEDEIIQLKIDGACT